MVSVRSFVLASLLVGSTAIASPDVRVYASANDPAAETEGETVVDGDPAAVYAIVLDYRKWTEVFSDVARVIVTAQHGVDAKVTLVKADGTRDNLVFHNQPQARLVYFEDTGNAHATVWGEIVFAPGETPGTTRVHTRLHASVHGIASLVVGDESVRKMREQKLSRDLAQILRYFRRTSSR